MPVLLLAPGVLVDAVMWVEEHHKTRLLECVPYGFQRLVVETLPESARAHDHALQMWERSDLLYSRHERLRRRPLDERE